MRFSGKEFAFFAKFFAVFFALELAIHIIPLKWLEVFIASTQAGMLRLESAGSLIFVEGGTFEITPSCTGLVSAGVLAALVFSLKKPGMREKIIVFASGTALLLIVNYFRVLAVVWSGTFFGAGFAEMLHMVSWFATSAAILGAWYFFTKKISGVKDFSGFL